MILFLCTGCTKTKEQKEYSTNLFYMDTYILVKIYSGDSQKANKALADVEEIYKKYHMLTDRYNEYPNINNIYYINNNDSQDSEINIEKELYELIKYGIDFYDESNGLLNINMGNVIDIWKQYRENGNGVPTFDELNNSGSININDIILLENNKVVNNHPNIDLGAISKGYTTEIVGNYLESIGIDKYLINAGGNVKVGNHYDNKKYKIGVENPNDTSQIYTTIVGNNISVVTSGSYQRFYEYNGKRYNHIINPETLYPGEYVKSVTIICPNSALADSLSTTLFLMDINEGLEYIKNYSSCGAIWYTNDDQIVKSEGISNYE